MPGPTSRDDYVGRSKFAGLAAAAQKRAEALVVVSPKCRVCGRPMVVGQEKSNGGAHFACDPSREAWDKLSKTSTACFECWCQVMRTGSCHHVGH